MKIIPREARRITYSTHIRNLKKRLSLNEHQHSVVIGSILGDGHLAENWSKTNYRLKMTHSVKQMEYISWKYTVLREWFLSEPKYYEKTKSVTVRTISHQEFTALRRIFYKGKKKIIPENIQDFLRNAVTIAVWFMDDGNAVRRDNGTIRGYNLNTQSFTEEENHRFVAIFKKHFDIPCTLNKNHKKYRLYIGVNGSERFRNLIKAYIIPSLQYKLC